MKKNLNLLVITLCVTMLCASSSKASKEDNSLTQISQEDQNRIEQEPSESSIENQLLSQSQELGSLEIKISPEIDPKETLESDSADLAIVEGFIEDLLNNHLFDDDYQFIEKHCSPDLLKYLRDQYEYDGCDGVCYAVWCFRTSANDVKSLTAVSDIISVKSLGNGWYTYEFYDMGWKGKKKVKASIVDGEVVLDKLETLYDEPSDP